MKVSPYRLQMFQNCRQQFKFVVIDDLTEVYSSPKPYLTMGAHVHNALKDLYDLPAEKRTAQVSESILRRRWKENRLGFADLEEEKKYGIQAIRMLRLFTHKMDVARDPVALEEFQNVECAPDVFLTGRIDRIDKEPEGLHIIDYKTGKFNEEWVSPEQLKLYAVMVANSMKAPVRKASFLYLATHTWYTIDVNEDLIEDAVEDLQEKVEQIRTEKEYSPEVGDHCKFCDFQEICPDKESVAKFLDEKEAAYKAKIELRKAQSE